ncbi:MAG TPA: DUF456 family protein [Anaerolineae bacterium]|nr:DUF456 family protein [Anaerolineae bacterium]
MDIQLFAEALTFATAMVLMVIGLFLTLVPIFPGIVFVWFVAVMYAVGTQFEVIGLGGVAILTVVMMVAATSDIWMPLLGANYGGANTKSMFLGGVGTTLGFFFGSVIPLLGSVVGSIVGYAGGILLGEYWQHEDWPRATKACIGGIIGWLLATAVQLGGGLLIMFLFAGQVLWWGA